MEEQKQSCNNKEVKQQASTSKPTRWADMVENEEKETEEKYEEDERKNNKWYVIFNGPFRGIYNSWAIASQHITGKPVQHQSYKTREEAEKALQQTYKVMALKEPSVQQPMQQRMVMKIPSIRSIPTTQEREEARKPTFQSFKNHWNTIINYEDKLEQNTIMGFYPVNRDGPKAVATEEATPELIYDLHQYELLDTIYTTTSKVFKHFPQKMKYIIRRYMETFAKGREIFLKYTSSHPIFNEKEELLLRTKAVILMGVSNNDYPSRDNLKNYEQRPDHLVKGLSAVCRALTNIEPSSQTKVNYSSFDIIIISRSKNKLIAEEFEAINRMTKEFTEISGTLAGLPISIKKQLCKQLINYEDHLCEWC
ncbi:hypothetical protein LINPERPRIM_LOCUS32754 [Linum perenne]